MPELRGRTAKAMRTQKSHRATYAGARLQARSGLAQAHYRRAWLETTAVAIITSIVKLDGQAKITAARQL